MSISWEDYNLPSFSIGYSRKQPMPFSVEKPYTGNSYVLNKNDTLDDLPVSWDVELKLTNEQAKEFNIFLDDFYAQDSDSVGFGVPFSEFTPNNLYFSKVMHTDVGDNLHTELTIVGGRPQATSANRGLYTYKFTVYSKTLDSTITDIPPLEIIEPPVPPVEEPDTFIMLEPAMLNTVASGSGTGTFIAMDSARSLGATVVLTFDGHAARSIGNGTEWEQLPRFLGTSADETVQAFDLAISDNGQKIMASFDNGISSISNDGGTTFVEQTQGLGVVDGTISGMQRVLMSGDGVTIFAIFSNGKISKTTDGGVIWQQLSYELGDTSSAQFKGDISADGQVIVIGAFTGVGITGETHVSYDGGENFIKYTNFIGMSDPATTGVSSVAVSDSGEIIVVSYDGGNSSVTNDGGASWLNRLIQETITGEVANGPLRAVSVAYNNQEIIGFFTSQGEDIVAYSNDYGDTWESIQSIDSELSGFAISSCFTNFVTMVTYLGSSWISNDQYVPPEPEQYPAGRAPEDDFVAVLPRYLNSGQTGGGTAKGAMSVDAINLFYGSTSGSGSTSNDTGNNWTIITEPGFGIESASPNVVLPNQMACSDDGQYVFAACEDGYFFRTTDGGVTWEEMARGINMPSTTQDLDTVCCSADGQTVFAGGGASMGSISYNAGETWSFVTDLSDNLVLTSCMSKDGQVIFVGHYDGFVSFSTNGGATFTELTKGLVGSESNFHWCSITPDGKKIIATKVNGELVISEDKGATWSLVLPVDLNMGIATPSEPKCGMSYDGQIIVLGAISGYVSYSDDGGSTFNTLTRGLNSGSTSSTVTDIITNGDTWWVVFTAGRTSISRGTV